MKCLILGQGKTGSSALFYSICEQIEGCNRVFEPNPITQEHLTPENVVVKKLIEFVEDEDIALIDQFDKKIFLVRDPRDSLISRLLYLVWDRKFVYDDEKLNIFIEALVQKESDPDSISVVELYDIMDRLDDIHVIQAVQRLNEKTVNFLSERGDDFYLFTYEDFIQGNLSGIRDYLGLDIDQDVTVDSEVSRVTRKKSFGDWKNWFTQDDSEFIKREFADIMSINSYNDDWEVNAHKVILPEFCSGYVRRIAQERREKLPLNP